MFTSMWLVSDCINYEYVISISYCWTSFPVDSELTQDRRYKGLFRLNHVYQFNSETTFRHDRRLIYLAFRHERRPIYVGCVLYLNNRTRISSESILFMFLLTGIRGISIYSDVKLASFAGHNLVLGSTVCW